MPDLASELSAITAALRAYEESHAQYRTININGVRELTERISCPCALCQAARVALGEEEHAQSLDSGTT